MNSAARRDCELLGPALVSYAYGEPHPEATKLKQHLRGCVACREELEALRETQSWIEAGLAPVDSTSVGRPRRWLRSSLVTAAFAAAALGAAMLFVGGPARERNPRRTATPAPAVARLLVPALSSKAIELDTFDARTDALRESLKQAGEEAW